MHFTRVQISSAFRGTVLFQCGDVPNYEVHQLKMLIMNLQMKCGRNMNMMIALQNDTRRGSYMLEPQTDA